MNVLSIGNSFSQDATHYLHQIARADGINLKSINLFIGGCSFERHYRNMLTGERAYSLECNGHATGFSVSLSEALASNEWDVVTVQQVSHLSFISETYFPYATSLVEYVHRFAPKAKVYMHRTWAYEDGGAKLAGLGRFESSREMHDMIVSENTAAAKDLALDGIIPAGNIFASFNDAGVTGLYRDGFHASLGLGRYALGLVWYRALTGMSVKNNSFCDLDIPTEPTLIEKAKEYADSLGLISI
ncbi:MAG: DUF4886 domain-containing protein [Clostridia bacterium]|nr:DUF4886 domain-containing protein [Clostridia bacterium]